jgi:dTDP-4-dehydrorhamnose 3,5-epimerase
MQVLDTAIPEVKLIRPARRTDERGYFSEVYSRRAWAEAGLAFDFVQDNQSLSLCRGVIRGLHFQVPPFAQTKLVRVVRGRILDVAVDVRYGSPSFGRFVAAVLSAEQSDQLLVPKGFAHGFCTLEPSTEVAYKVDAFYEPGHDRGLLWSDPGLGIAWPVRPQDAILSDRDRRHPRLSELPRYFLYAEDDRWRIPNPPWDQRSAEGAAAARRLPALRP